MQQADIQWKYFTYLTLSHWCTCSTFENFFETIYEENQCMCVRETIFPQCVISHGKLYERWSWRVSCFESCLWMGNRKLLANCIFIFDAHVGSVKLCRQKNLWRRLMESRSEWKWSKTHRVMTHKVLIIYDARPQVHLDFFIWFTLHQVVNNVMCNVTDQILSLLFIFFSFLVKATLLINKYTTQYTFHITETNGKCYTVYEKDRGSFRDVTIKCVFYQVWSAYHWKLLRLTHFVFREEYLWWHWPWSTLSVLLMLQWA